MFKPVFIYTPKSGSRIFKKEIPYEPEMVLVLWINHSYHFWAPNYVVLTYNTVEPKKYYRDELKVFTFSIDCSICPLAWDDKGQINLICRRDKAFQINKMISQFASTKKAIVENDAILLIERCAYFSENDGIIPSVASICGKNYITPKFDEIKTWSPWEIIEINGSYDKGEKK